METNRYATQGEWVTIETQEMGWVRCIKTPSSESAGSVARTLNAAPDLLLGLKEAEATFAYIAAGAGKRDVDWSKLARNAREAIAKATGEPVMAA